MPRLNGIIIELIKPLFKGLEKDYTKFFLSLGFEFKAHNAVSYKSAKNLIDRNLGQDRINVVICDISLGAGDLAGFLVIQSLKKMYPDILIIGNSSKPITYRHSAVKDVTFDMYVDKMLLSRFDKSYVDTLKVSFFEKFRNNLNFKISPKSEIDSERFSNGYLNREIWALVAQCLFQGYGVDDLVCANHVMLTPLTGGYSGSDVFRMDILNSKSKLKSIPGVLKITDWKKASEEAENYKKYVKWALPYTWRVELLGEGRAGKKGAVCYSFILSDHTSFDSLTKHLEEGNCAAVEKVIEFIFSTSDQTWYNESIVKAEENISSFYNNRYFGQNTLMETPEIFNSKAQKFLDAIVENDEINIPRLKVKIPEPTSWLFSRNFGSYQSGICHGDLNSNNVIFAKNNQVIFIDFQATGRGHVFCDFITLEQSIRSYFRESESSAKEMLFWEGMISSDEVIKGNDYPVDMPDMYKMMLKIRRAALDNFKDSSLWN